MIDLKLNCKCKRLPRDIITGCECFSSLNPKSRHDPPLLQAIAQRW